MKGKLSQGILKIAREVIGVELVSALEWHEQRCPYTREPHRHFCGTWCPQFGDIIGPMHMSCPDSMRLLEQGTEIKICGGRTLVFSEFSIEK